MLFMDSALLTCIFFFFFFFFFNDTATTEIYTLSLHDALPIWRRSATSRRPAAPSWSSSRGARCRAWPLSRRPPDAHAARDRQLEDVRHPRRGAAARHRRARRAQTLEGRRRRPLPAVHRAGGRRRDPPGHPHRPRRAELPLRGLRRAHGRDRAADARRARLSQRAG